MRIIPVLLSLGLALGGCTYRPTATELVRIVDSSADVRSCRRLAEVSGPVATVPGFKAATAAMLESTVALGGTDLYLEPQFEDWSSVRGIAYRCPVAGESVTTVVRAKG